MLNFYLKSEEWYHQQTELSDTEWHLANHLHKLKTLGGLSNFLREPPLYLVRNFELIFPIFVH